MIRTKDLFEEIQQYSSLNQNEREADLDGRLSLLVDWEETPLLTRKYLPTFITRERARHVIIQHQRPSVSR